MTRLLVSVDVGGTLCHVDGMSVAAMLAAESPLAPEDARRIMREKLHNKPSITSEVIADVCNALRIPTSIFPRTVKASAPKLLPGAVAALGYMSQQATLVTLSNVTCLEAGTDQMRELLSPWVVDHFPSWRTGHSKPDPAAFRHVAGACCTSTADMVHIGDDWLCDIIGARSAGVTAVWISKGRSVPEPKRLVDRGVLVAADLAAASQHITDLAARRRS